MAAATAAVLVAVVLLAAWVPAHRAARIEPTLALKGSEEFYVSKCSVDSIVRHRDGG